MTVWAISDLHLSFANPEGRERFAGRWRDHAEKVEREWRTVVGADDLVLIPGDISQARKHRDVQPDLAWLARLPGTKVLSAGNHDAWFSSVESIRPMLRRSLLAVGGDAIATQGVIVCGTKGAPITVDEPSDPALERERKALDRALDAASKLRMAAEPLLVLWHYPPFDSHRRPGPIVDRLEAAKATACVYGHLHAESQWALAVQGIVGTVRYHCVAADAIGFRPLRLDMSHNAQFDPTNVSSKAT